MDTTPSTISGGEDLKWSKLEGLREKWGFAGKGATPQEFFKNGKQGGGKPAAGVISDIMARKAGKCRGGEGGLGEKGGEKRAATEKETGGEDEDISTLSQKGLILQRSRAKREGSYGGGTRGIFRGPENHPVRSGKKLRIEIVSTRGGS